jgi:hypothetical protein
LINEPDGHAAEHKQIGLKKRQEKPEIKEHDLSAVKAK